MSALLLYTGTDETSMHSSDTRLVQTLCVMSYSFELNHNMTGPTENHPHLDLISGFYSLAPSES